MNDRAIDAFARTDELEPAIAATIAGIHAARASGPYHLASLDDVAARLLPFLAARGLEAPQVHRLRRMGGGASKEQFVFELRAQGMSPRRCVLRMDPLEAAVITSRRREFEALRYVHGRLPAPEALWVDEDGGALGRPALITSFVDGVTRPSAIVSNVSGFGTVLGDDLRRRLSEPFLRHLVTLHGLNVRDPALAAFAVPDAFPEQAALWQVNWWTTVWRNDALAGIPLLGLAERWMRENLPASADLVLVHADYRTGNYLFDEARAEITAVLDWELVHVGDYHQDLAWIGITSWSPVIDGVRLASGLMTSDELCDRYAAATGRAVDRATLFFYQVLGLYQCAVICLGTSLRAAHEAHNHQDALLSWLAAAGYVFLDDLRALLEAGSGGARTLADRDRAEERRLWVE
ncbi:MAG: phosphotransferase family protein [Gammaproteobacteria bacterium]|nr:phosphotransferase family protein [Gammaproteobacteria bacterium]